MTLDAIAESITPVGFAAAIIGLGLCLLVLVLRSRARNMAQGALETTAADRIASRKVSDSTAPERTSPKPAFKPFVPTKEDSASSES